MTGFVEPWALLALPVVLLPFLLERIARRRGEPVPFSSLYLLERARRSPSRRTTSPARWRALLRALALGLLVLTAARPVAPGSGDPAAHRPSRLVVAVDVSASVRQRAEGRTAWEGIRASADSLLALAGAEDRLALAAVADRVVGWWEGPGPALRGRLAALEPMSHPSDWPAAIGGLESRLENGTESYLLTDGSRGARGPAADDRNRGGPKARGYRALWVWPGSLGGSGAPAANRALARVTWLGAEAVGLEATAWGRGVPPAAVVGRLVGARVVERVSIVLAASGTPRGGPAGAWAIPDTATFAFAEPDRHPFDDRRWVARGAPGATYRAVRWAPPDEPPEPGGLFWEAAVAAVPRGARAERARSLAELASRPPELAILPLRAYRADEAALLADLTAAGTRLLFVPTCADPACVPPPGWLPDPAPAVPDVAWSLGPAERQSALTPRPEGVGLAPVPEHLLAEVPIRGALRLLGGPAPDVVWRLTSGAAAFWARGSVALWLVPFGPPVTRLGTTPIFPLVAEVALGAWDPRWGAGGAETRVGEPLLAPPGSIVAGPLHDPEPRSWSVAPGVPPPRPEEPGLYRVDLPRGDDPAVRPEAGATSFIAVNADPMEGDLTPVTPGEWREGWGAAPAAPGAWRAALFPRRRGPELWPWALALAVAALAAEAAVRRAGVHK